MKKYKIGEFAKIVGVTPDFIKHYENYGLLKPDISESKYRYYDFVDAIYFFEFFKYKKWGYSIKEMTELMQEDSVASYMDKLKEQSNVVKKNMCIEDMMLVDCESNYDRFVEHLNEWYILPHFPSYYVHHTKNEEVIEGESLKQTVEQMIECLPISKECALGYLDENGNLTDDSYWGFFLPQKPYKWFGLEPNENTIPILESRYFEMNCCFELDSDIGNASFKKDFEKVKEVMKQNNLTPDGYMTFQIHIDLVQDYKHYQYGVVRVPIK